MDPSSGRDRKTNSSPSEPENPFIKFKNFADSQISSLLQGIIGLPSAISRRSSEHSRWADIDEDLRRRDELQARQKLIQEQWRDAAAVIAGGNPAMTGGDIPIKPLQYQASQASGYVSRAQAAAADNRQESSNGEKKDNPKAVQDLPLYSPVTRELFENFDPKEALSGAFQGFSGLGGFGRHEFGVPPPTFDSTGMIKTLTLTMLKVSSILHSEYSLLPYLLFSPYSPIKLESESEMSISRRNDKFRYCAAFEDLIRISQGRESFVHSHHTAERLSNSLFFNAPGQNQWFWMLFLHRDGILQQKRQDSDPVPDLKEWRAIGSFPQGSDLDMFEHVQEMPKMPNPLAAQSSFPDEAFVYTGHFNKERMEALRQIQAQAARDLVRQHELPPRGMTKEDAERIHAAAQTMKHTEKASATEKKVVSTSTTTERFTHEDGTVETSITIWKQFDDGRETTTTTSHVEEPAWDDKEQSSWPDDRAPEHEQKEPEKKEKKEKKGWFWN
jgi:hypothetical protein